MSLRWSDIAGFRLGYKHFAPPERRRLARARTILRRTTAMAFHSVRTATVFAPLGAQWFSLRWDRNGFRSARSDMFIAPN